MLAVITLGLISLDGFSRPGMTISQVVSEALAGLAGLALLVQALLDQRKEQAVQVRGLLILLMVVVGGGCGGTGGEVLSVASASPCVFEFALA